MINLLKLIHTTYNTSSVIWEKYQQQKLYSCDCATHDENTSFHIWGSAYLFGDKGLCLCMYNNNKMPSNIIKRCAQFLIKYLDTVYLSQPFIVAAISDFSETYGRRVQSLCTSDVCVMSGALCSHWGLKTAQFKKYWAGSIN